jgi:hypothetical protein
MNQSGHQQGREMGQRRRVTHNKRSNGQSTKYRDQRHVPTSDISFGANISSPAGVMNVPLPPPLLSKPYRHSTAPVAPLRPTTLHCHWESQSVVGGGTQRTPSRAINNATGGGDRQVSETSTECVQHASSVRRSHYQHQTRAGGGRRRKRSNATRIELGQAYGAGARVWRPA